MTESQALVDFRASERADWTLPVTSESSLGGNFGAR